MLSYSNGQDINSIGTAIYSQIMGYDALKVVELLSRRSFYDDELVAEKTNMKRHFDYKTLYA